MLGGWNLTIEPDGSGWFAHGTTRYNSGYFPAGTFTTQHLIEYEYRIWSPTDMIRHAVHASRKFGSGVESGQELLDLVEWEPPKRSMWSDLK